MSPTASKMKIQAVLFDLDGVVVFTDHYHYLAWKRLADQRGWRFDETINERLRGVSRMESLQIILDENGVALDEDEKLACAEQKNAWYREYLQGINADDLYPHAVEFLEALKTRQVKLALCSSSRNAAEVLERLDLGRYFDVVITGNDITRTKPDPQLFQMAAERLGVNPFHCLVFEDAFSGVEAALAAEMKCIGVGTPEKLPNAPATITAYEDIEIDALLQTARPRGVTPEPWRVTQREIQPGQSKYWETVFALTNGYMGLRGTYEQEDSLIEPHSYPGMFINNIREYLPYNYVIQYVALPQRRHGILNLNDWRMFNLTADGERLSLCGQNVMSFERFLDLKRGRVESELVFKTASGKRIRVRSVRVVSMVRRHVAAIRYRVEALDGPADVVIESVIRGRSHSAVLGDGDHVECVEQTADGPRQSLVYRTRTDAQTVALALGHSVTNRASIDSQMQPERFETKFSASLGAGETLTVDKTACFYTSLETDPAQALPSARRELDSAQRDGFDALLDEQAAFWQAYWDVADIQIDGSAADQQAVRFNLFHLRQANPEDGRNSISANGLTGDHYWGSVFWDTEMFMLGHFNYTQPETVRPLLAYRYGILDKARERARIERMPGARYSWYSMTGEENGCNAFMALIAYHLMPAIAHGLWHYVKATSDWEFLYECGAEMLFETSRNLFSVGEFLPIRGNQFCMNAVCGPDENGTAVNNNCYTNVMTQWHFRFALATHEKMSQACPGKLAALAERIALRAEELDDWRRAADNMYVPYHEGLGVHEQDDTYLYRYPVDMDKIAKNRSMGLDMPAATLLRMQLTKQADVVLLMFVMGDQFSREQKLANYEFYDARTNHGSSLSPGVHSIVAAEVGKIDQAYAYFRHSAFLDLYDLKENSYEGMHLACAGAVWMCMVNGFAGMRDYDSGLLFNPVLPSAWQGYQFKLVYEGRLLEVRIDRNGHAFRLLTGEAVSFRVHGQEVSLTPDSPSWTGAAAAVE